MGDLTTCQPGWWAVFERTADKKGFDVEPIACWLAVKTDDGTLEVRPMCPMGVELADATTAANYIGIVGPSRNNATLMEQIAVLVTATAAARTKPSA